MLRWANKKLNEPKPLTLWFLKIFRLSFFYESIGANDPQVWCQPIITCGPRGMVGRIYVVNHNALLHTKYRSCRFMVSKDFFKVIPYYTVSLWKLKTLRVWSI